MLGSLYPPQLKGIYSPHPECPSFCPHGDTMLPRVTFLTLTEVMDRLSIKLIDDPHAYVRVILTKLKESNPILHGFLVRQKEHHGFATLLCACVVYDLLEVQARKLRELGDI